MSPAPAESVPATAPDHAAFDRAAIAILGAMVSLIAVLTLALVQLSERPDDTALPVAASAAPQPRDALAHKGRGPARASDAGPRIGGRRAGGRD